MTDSDPLKLNERVYAYAGELMTELEQGSRRVDIRERLAVAMFIEKVAAKVKGESADVGSAIRKYTPAFQTANGIGGARTDARSAAESYDAGIPSGSTDSEYPGGAEPAANRPG